MQQTLLVDRNYMALTVVNWKRAVKLLVKGKAEMVETASHFIIEGAKKIRLSTILRLVVDIPWRAHKQRIKFSRRNVLLRDELICQYCGIKVSKKSATVDHINPRSKGGKNCYLNCVTSCRKCNNKKGDRTPEEAGMSLLKSPRRPSFLMLYRGYLSNMPEEWKDYVIGAI